jgi:hypothetical protein
MQREGLLPGFVAGDTKIHHDEHRHSCAASPSMA